MTQLHDASEQQASGKKSTLNARALFTFFALSVLAPTSPLAELQPPSVSADEDPSRFDEAIKHWNRNRMHQRLEKRLEALERLVSTGAPEALDIALKEVERTGKFSDQLAELIAPQIAQHFSDTEKFKETFFRAFQGPLKDPEYSWLAYQVFVSWVQEGKESVVLNSLLDFSDNPYFYAAALHALGTRPDATMIELAAVELIRLPEDGIAHTLRIGGIIRLINANAPDLENEKHREVLNTLIQVLEQRGIAPRAKEHIKRFLRRLFQSEDTYDTVTQWQKALEDRRARLSLDRDGYHVPENKPNFLGTAAAGKHICYVVDVSDSMRRPFDPISKEGTRRYPLNQATDEVLGTERFAWDQIYSRIDLAREAIKASLLSLSSDQYFSIVLYDDRARSLSTTPKLVPATARNVRSAIRALDRIKPDDATNMHEGLERIFGMNREGVSEQNSYVGSRALLGGPDTIFVLSDGVPNRDSYSSPDPRQSRRRRNKGPLYARIENLVLATEKLNLFLGADIHCIGIAEAPVELLQEIAKRGNGRAVFPRRPG